MVRQLVAEAAWQARRRSPTVRAFFDRVQQGDPQRKKIALVATGHYLVRAMWAMLKRGTYWQENPTAIKTSSVTANRRSRITGSPSDDRHAAEPN